MPTGVPTSVPTTVITTLPKMALAKPPLLPGGGVFCVKRSSDSAGTPFTTSDPMIRNKMSSPSPVAVSDRARIPKLTPRRRL